jgi:hypothetical protein
MAVTFHISTHTLLMYTFPFHSTFYELYIRHGVINNYSIKQSVSVKKHVIKSEVMPHYKRFKGVGTLQFILASCMWKLSGTVKYKQLSSPTHMADGLVHKRMQCCLNVFQVETKIRAGKQIYIKLRCRQHNGPLSVGEHSAWFLFSRWNGNPEVMFLLVFRLFLLVSIY